MNKKIIIIITVISSSFLLLNCTWFTGSAREVAQEDIPSTNIDDQLNARCIDNDGDGYGVDCFAGPDCDDNNPEINPGAAEICKDNLDNNCDGFKDFIDEDGDGFNACFNDCDDKNKNYNKGIQCNFDGLTCGDFFLCASQCPCLPPENCSDGIDNDCDGLADAADPNCDKTICPDEDNDGYSPNGGICGNIDCDDKNSEIHPCQEEICDDRIDNNCDGLIDSIDNDGDGYDTCDAVLPDCNDNDYTINPGADEICDDGIDNDCDNHIDGADNDSDGYNICGDGDCNDNNPNVNPGQAEICGNDIDDNCDGLVDYVDNNGDGISDCCGDGEVDEPFEQCDDGNDDMYDNCSNYCNYNRFTKNPDVIKSYGSPCECLSGCDDKDFSTGTIVGCENITEIPYGSELACYRSIHVTDMGTNQKAYIANGYCTVMALKCSGTGCAFAPSVGDFDNFTTCPPKTVLVETVTYVGIVTIRAKACPKECSSNSDCRLSPEWDSFWTTEDPDDTTTHISNYQCITNYLPGKKFCYDPRNL